MSISSSHQLDYGSATSVHAKVKNVQVALANCIGSSDPARAQYWFGYLTELVNQLDNEMAEAVDFDGSW